MYQNCLIDGLEHVTIKVNFIKILKDKIKIPNTAHKNIIKSTKNNIKI